MFMVVMIWSAVCCLTTLCSVVAGWLLSTRKWGQQLPQSTDNNALDYIYM